MGAAISHLQQLDESDTAGLHVRAFLDPSSRAEQRGEKSDLELAIFHGRTTLVLFPSESPLLALVLYILARLFEKMDGQDFVIANLEIAIECLQKAVDLTPAGNPDRAEYLNTFSIYLRTRYARRGKVEDLAQAFKYAREAVDLTPTDNPNGARRLNNLSIFLNI